MKKLLFLFLFAFALSAFSQDVIIKMNGEEYNVDVRAITPHVVAYIDSDYSTTKTLAISVDSVFMVKYADGSKTLIDHTPSSVVVPQIVTETKEVIIRDTVYLEAEPEEIKVAEKIKFTNSYSRFYYAGESIRERDILDMMVMTNNQEFINEHDILKNHIKKKRLNNWMQLTVLPTFIVGVALSAVSLNGVYMLLPISHSSALMVASQFHANAEKKKLIRAVKALNSYLDDYPEFEEVIRKNFLY